jgi:hypothetical protein
MSMGRTHHAATNREVLQRHGAFALGSELDILHVRVHGVVHSCNSAWKYVENPSIKNYVGNQTARLHRDVFKEHTMLRHLTLDNATILELDSNTLLPQLHEKPGVRMSSPYRKGQA